MATNILNLSGLITDPVVITDRTGRDWTIHDGLPLRTALALMQLAPAWQTGAIDAETLLGTVRGVLAVFRRTNPQVTEDDILDNFDVDDMITIILFLSTRVEERARASQAGSASDATLEESPTQPEAPTAMEPTKKPKK